MLGRVVKRDRPIQVPLARRDFPSKHQGKSHEAMPFHKRECRPLRLRQREELRREIANDVAVESHIARDQKA